MVDTRRGFMNRDVRSGRSIGFAGRPARRGLTLVELVVAFAIMLILVVGLLAVYGQNAATVRSTQIMETAQTLAELQVEDLRSFSMATLEQMVQGISPDPVNYPPDANTVSNIEYVSSGTDAFYDSIFQLPDIDVVTLDDVSHTASDLATRDLPSGFVGMLPTSVEVGPRHPRDDGTSPEDDVYGVRVMKSAVPNIMKRVQVKLVGDGTYTGSSPTVPVAGYEWNVDQTYREYMFQYTVTVKWTDVAGPHRYSVSGYLGTHVAAAPSGG